MKLSPFHFTKVLVVAVFPILLFSCDSSNKEIEEATTEQKTFSEPVSKYTPKSLGELINTKEQSLNSAPHNSKANIRKNLIKLYVSYADLFPNDNSSPDYLFKAGNESINVQDYEGALKYYERVEKKYLGYQKRPEVMYLQGFVYSTYTSDFGLAKAKYEELIKRYPKHVLSEQAKLSLEHIGLTDEEIIRKFEKQNS